MLLQEKKQIRASTYKTNVSSIFVRFPNYLKVSVVEETLNRVAIEVFMDTFSSESYINYRLFERFKLFLKGPCTITTDSTSHYAQVKEAVAVNLEIFNNIYTKFKLGVCHAISSIITT